MKAIQFNLTIPRYILGLGLGKLSSDVYWSGLTCTQYKDIPDPQLPGEDWVMVKTRLGGICGTDMSAVKLTASTYSSPLVTFPFVIGHENIGRIEKIGCEVKNWEVGDRVVVEPALWCKPRGIKQLCPYCAKGEINHCINITKGSVSPGISTGLCHDTGGSWAPYFVAHEEQLYKVPENISDENGMMIEPFVIGLHTALKYFPQDSEQVLIIGAGTIGLCVLAALRALGSEAELIVVARYPFQAEAARTLGANHVIRGSRDSSYYESIVDLTGADLKNPIMGKPLVMGGVDRVFDCVGSNSSLDDAMRLTRNGGQVIFVGEPGMVKNLDWTPIFTQDLAVNAAYLYDHNEQYKGQIWKTFDLAIHLMENEGVDIGWMVTHKFALNEYKQAFSVSDHKKQEEAIKIAFEFPY
ncbi:MAG: zinc-binding dehydrogenase [Anaerolineales bacterium]|nr:zinc-binding dehydrogenase [Anaerolineales bacterium]